MRCDGCFHGRRYSSADLRQSPANFDPTVKAALDAAKTKIASGDVAAALALYRSTWETCAARSDHYHASVVAHMAGVIDPDLDAKLEWNLWALREADAVADRSPRILGFYPSLYNNLAVAYGLRGAHQAALRHMELAADRLGDLEPGPYADRVRASVEAQLAKLRAEAAQRAAGVIG